MRLAQHSGELTDAVGASSTLRWLITGLDWLDHLLARAVEAAAIAYGPAASTDAFRGLHLDAGDMAQLLERAPGRSAFVTLSDCPLFTPDALDADRGERHRTAFGRTFDLLPFDWCALLIALAPEVDIRYERLYAYLQDDVTRKRPTVDLVLNLLCSSVEDRWIARRHFTPAASLLRHYLVSLTPDANGSPSILAQCITPNPQVTRYLMEVDGLDERLAPFCRLHIPEADIDALPVSAALRRTFHALVSVDGQSEVPLRLYFYGQPGTGRKRAGEALGAALNRKILHVTMSQVAATGESLTRTLPLLFLEAWSHHAILVIDDTESLRDDLSAAATFRDLLDRPYDIPVILLGEEPLPAHQNDVFLPIEFDEMDTVTRRDCWRACLEVAATELEPGALRALADRYLLSPAQIAAAIGAAGHRTRLRSLSTVTSAPANYEIDLDDLYAGAREQSDRGLAALTCKINPLYTWNDIVLPADALNQLREMCSRVVYRHQVLDTWGFGSKLSQGKGVNALFAGPSGTGKTMAAEVIANELKLELYKIDLSGVVSKYIGETEKNLDRIFKAAESANAILFFDEADALFGKRSEVRDSHDRYANVEVSYLLQKMEQHQGVTILATNLRGNLDEAFLRRLAFLVHFPFPEEPDRRRIWAGIWPSQTPLAEDVDLDYLTHRFKLSGGNIKNVALAAAFLAANEGMPVTMAHLLQAVRREYQKLGKVLTDAELGPASSTNGTQAMREVSQR